MYNTVLISINVFVIHRSLVSHLDKYNNIHIIYAHGLTGAVQLGYKLPNLGFIPPHLEFFLCQTPGQKGKVPCL